MEVYESLQRFTEDWTWAQYARGRKRVAGRKRQREPSKESVGSPKKYKQWTEESTQGVLKVAAEGMGVNRAALEYRDALPGHSDDGVPSTMPSSGTSPAWLQGWSPYLTQDEKKELVDYLIACLDISYPKSEMK